MSLFLNVYIFIMVMFFVTIPMYLQVYRWYNSNGWAETNLNTHLGFWYSNSKSGTQGHVHMMYLPSGNDAVGIILCNV